MYTNFQFHVFYVVLSHFHMYCCILTLDRADNQRCTCVNKRKKKRKQVGIMKEYRQVPVAFELVGDWNARVRARLQTEGCWATPSKMRLSNPIQDAEEVLSGFLKIRSWVNIAVCPCLHLSLTHNRNINPLENKVCEIHIFIKKCVLFIYWSSSFMFNNVTAYICICIKVYNSMSKFLPNMVLPDN